MLDIHIDLGKLVVASGPVSGGGLKLSNGVDPEGGQAVYRTAPATPGLLIIYIYIFLIESYADFKFFLLFMEQLLLCHMIIKITRNDQNLYI